MTGEPLSPDRPLVVGQICHGGLGGSSRIAGRLANALARRGHRVELFSLYALPWPLDDRVVSHRRHERDTGAGGPLYWDWTEADKAAFCAMLAGRLAARRFDILHYHYAQPFAGLLRRIASGRYAEMPAVVGTLHGTDLTRCLRDPVALSELKRNLGATDALTTVSRHMQHLFGRLGTAANQPRLLPNFVEEEWPEAPPRPRNGKPVLLHISNFRSVKDVSLLARLFLAIRRRVDADLWLMGDGPDLPRLRAMLERTPAADSVRTLGVRPDPAEALGQASMLLSTSSEEGFGLAVLEAMASGAVVVATGVGGVPELVTDDVTGLLFEPSEPDAAAARVAALLGDPDRLGRMAREAALRANAMRENRAIGLYEALYREHSVRRPALLAD